MIWSGLTFHSLQSHKSLHSKTHPWLCWSKDTVCLHLNVPPKTNIQTTFWIIPSSKSTWNFNFYWTIQRCWGFWLISSTSTTFCFSLPRITFLVEHVSLEDKLWMSTSPNQPPKTLGFPTSVLARRNVSPALGQCATPMESPPYTDLCWTSNFPSDNVRTDSGYNKKFTFGYWNT